MGVRIVHDRDQGLAALFCSTSDFAFGPVFSRTREHDADGRWCLSAFDLFTAQLDQQQQG